MVKMKDKRVIAAAAAILIVVIGGLVYWKKSKPAADSAEADVTRGDLELHFLDSGELTPKVYIDIAAKVSGRVTEVSVEEGQLIRKGARLAVIQPGRTEAEKFVPLTVIAPIAGTVMRFQPRDGSPSVEGKITKLGDYVSGLLDTSNPTYLMTVADLTRLIVKMKISEMDVLKLREGMPVTVTIDAIPGEKIPAKVALISPQAERDSNNLKNFKVEVVLLKADARLKPGMTARVDGLLDTRKNVVKIPLAAVFEDAGKSFAYVKSGKKPRKTELNLGLRSELDAEVLGGVAPGDKVLTEKPEDKPKS